MLLGRGADGSILDEDGLTAGELAIKEGKHECAKLIQMVNKEVRPTPPLAPQTHLPADPPATIVWHNTTPGH